MVSNSEFELESTIKSLYSICGNCGECSLTCPPHFYGLFNPMGLLRSLQRDGIESTILSQPLFNCLTCNRCMTNCPNADPKRGMDFAELIRHLRQYASEKKLLVPHTQNKNSSFQITRKIEDLKILKNKEFILSINDLNTQKNGPIAYFCGDIVKFSENKDITYIDWKSIISAPIKILNKVNVIPAIIDMYGSGHDEYWTGNNDIFMEIAKTNIKLYRDAQIHTIICSDAESYYMWKNVYPNIDKNFNFEVFHLSEYLLKDKLIKDLIFDVSFKINYIIHDSSRLGRLNPTLFNSQRVVLDQIQDITRIEIEDSKEYAYDFRSSYYLSEPVKRERMINARLNELSIFNASYFIINSHRALVSLEKHLLNTQVPNLPQLREWSVFISRFLP